ncbi:MAG: tetratricopeptide repeat protein [Methylotenera sp.]|nr:tetratricopeptide repeat protein [Methylotenera sp.]
MPRNAAQCYPSAMTDTLPTCLSLDTVCAITETSKSTWRRRMAKGDFTRQADDARGRTMLLWSEVAPHICVRLAPEDKQTLVLADAGQAEAQDDLGQLFLMSEKYPAAVYWFGLAAQQNHPDAMQWLGHCHLNGKGVAQDENLGLMWLAKAAARGHVIAQGLMKALIGARAG